MESKDSIVDDKKLRASIIWILLAMMFFAVIVAGTAVWEFSQDSQTRGIMDEPY